MTSRCNTVWRNTALYVLKVLLTYITLEHAVALTRSMLHYSCLCTAQRTPEPVKLPDWWAVGGLPWLHNHAPADTSISINTAHLFNKANEAPSMHSSHADEATPNEQLHVCTNGDRHMLPQICKQVALSIHAAAALGWLASMLRSLAPPSAMHGMQLQTACFPARRHMHSEQAEHCLVKLPHMTRLAYCLQEQSVTCDMSLR